MLYRVLKASFFDHPTLRVARELLGKYLVRRIGRRTVACRITEVEAYVGFTDLASQASRGKTKRNQVMFGKPGHWYVYFTYGMHWMANVVTNREGYPGVVLLRGVDGVSGPGRLTKFFKIDKQLNAKPVSRKTGLWIEDRGAKVSPRSIRRSKRIGINCDPVWQNKLWRFSI